MTDGNDLIQGHLDGVLTPEQEAELNAWVKRDQANAKAFAAAVFLHGRLRDETRLLGDARPAGPPRQPRWRPAPVLSALASAAAVLMVVLWWSSPAPLSAATELDRLISRQAAGDRTYRITSLDAEPERGDGRRPPLDGATLHVRPPDQYVLIRKYEDGRPFVTGSDGERGWAAPPDGAVRVSGDPLRFRGPVPGHQHGIPFADLRSDLARLRDAYVVTLLGRDTAGLRGLLAEKKSPEYRGPARVELRYDADNGVIHWMVFAGMPRARGGPNKVAVELVDRRDLGPNFFGHQAHHEPGRRVVEDD